MDNDIILTGIVLKDMPIGDYDKRVSLLTLERGRVSAFIKGAKRSKGSTLQSIGPFCFGDFYIYDSRNSITVKKAEIKERFDKVQNNLINIAYGSYFLECAEYYSRENSDEKERIKLLYQSLRALSSDKFDPEFVMLVFELKNIAILGEYPNVFSCVSCNKEENLHYFSFEKRMAVCDLCATKIGNLYKISESLAYSLWFIFTTPIEKLFSFKLSEKAQRELREFTDRYKSLYFRHSFKTYEMLSVLTS